MIASWMLYALVVGGLITLAATAIDRVAAARGRPVRFVWLVALALSILWPLGGAARRLMPVSERPATVLPFTIVLPSTTVAPGGPIDQTLLVDRLLMSLWVGLSILFIARLTLAVVSLRRTRDAWQMRDVDGTAVRLSENVGPAVIGLRSMDVVLPEWIMTLEPSLRAIVLRHEEEHRAARDPYLLFAAGVAVALMPWNVALWLQARRLRLAIEMDCDGRVLRAHPSPERYGMLMLTIAQRRSVAPAMFAPMLSEPATQLERRIIAMRTTTRKLTRLTIYGGSMLAGAALLFACALQSDGPTGPSPSSSATPARMSASQTYFEFQVERQVSPAPGNKAPRYPDLLRSQGISGEVLAQFVVDTSGRAIMSTFKVLKSTHELFTATVRDNLPAIQFNPAEVGGRKVKQLVQMPFQFSLSKESAADAPAAGAGSAATGRGSPQGVRKLEPVVVTTRPGAGPTRVSDNMTLFEFQVEKQARPLPSNMPARYPDVLRTAKIEGQVLAQFTVDANGVPDSATFKVLKSSHDLFSDAVRANISSMRFSPAEVGGRPVKQLVQMPFVFSLTK